MNRIEIWIPAVAAVISFFSIVLMLFFRYKDQKIKGKNFLYKRMREFKNWCNNYSEVLRKRNEHIIHNSAYSLSQEILKEQDIVDAKILFMDTILTSNALNYIGFYGEKEPWVDIKYNKNISNKFIDEINKFGSNLFDLAFDLANARKKIIKDVNKYKSLNIHDIESQKIKENFHDLIIDFKYKVFYKLVKEII